MRHFVEKGLNSKLNVCRQATKRRRGGSLRLTPQSLESEVLLNANVCPLGYDRHLVISSISRYFSPRADFPTTDNARMQNRKTTITKGEFARLSPWFFITVVKAPRAYALDGWVRKRSRELRRFLSAHYGCGHVGVIVFGGFRFQLLVY